ncbi:MAG TPA: hypothetical protein VNZ86_06400 [Bacteroidia bacterium]|jgi:hypothetical protein|nr:hypothetical protein [Bacteroidia bacterium]
MRNLILFVAYFVCLEFGYAQQSPGKDLITETGYGHLIIGKSVIQEMIKENGSEYRLDSTKYLWGLANMGGGCLRLERMKKFYRYLSKGITYIVTNGDTISGVIFYKPFAGTTAKGVILNQTKVSALKISDVKKECKRYHPDRLGLDHHNRFSEQAKQYVRVDEIYYGFNRVRGRITEIRVGR